MPEDVPVGERVSFEGWEGAPEAVLNPKKKLWEKIAPDLKTNAGKHLPHLLAPADSCLVSSSGDLAYYMWLDVKHAGGAVTSLVERALGLEEA